MLSHPACIHRNTYAARVGGKVGSAVVIDTVAGGNSIVVDRQQQPTAGDIPPFTIFIAVRLSSIEVPTCR